MSVGAGLRYSDFCDYHYSNGNNGPFGYGQHPWLQNTIDLLLRARAVAVIWMLVGARSSADRWLGVANVVISVAGGTIAVWDVVRQSERNPYCTTHGLWPTALLVVPLVLLGLGVNHGIRRSTSGRSASPEPVANRDP